MYNARLALTSVIFQISVQAVTFGNRIRVVRGSDAPISDGQADLVIFFVPRLSPFTVFKTI